YWILATSAKQATGARVQDHAIDVDDGHLVATGPVVGVEDHRLFERSADMGGGQKDAVEASGQCKARCEHDPSRHGRVPRVPKGRGIIGGAANRVKGSGSSRPSRLLFCPADGL